MLLRLSVCRRLARHRGSRLGLGHVPFAACGGSAFARRGRGCAQRRLLAFAAWRRGAAADVMLAEVGTNGGGLVVD